MADTPTGWGRLTSALNHSTLALSATGRGGGTGYGTGFFIGPGLVLTCAHVVCPDGRPAAMVEGMWRDSGGEQHRLSFMPVTDTDVRPFAGGTGADLALLRLSALPQGHPCVALSRGPGDLEPDKKLYVHGHPRHAYWGGDSFDLSVVGVSRHRAGAILVKAIGSEVWGGVSGAPAIDMESGCVVGVLRAKQPAEGTGREYESRLVPAPVVWDSFPELAQVQHLGLPQLDEWLDWLSDAQLQQANWRCSGPDMTDYMTLVREATEHSGYLEALASSLRARGAAPRMGDIYVPVRAKPGHDNESPASRCMPVESSALAGGAHIVGGPGTGKSSLLRAVARDVAEQWLNGSLSDYVPVYAAAPVLASSTGPGGRWDPFAMLESAVAADLRPALALQPGRTSKSPLARAFEDPPFPARKWLVLVDAVDEVQDGQLRDLLEDALTKYASTPHLALVVTSREWFWSRGIEQAGLESLRLCRLNESMHRALVAKCLAAFRLHGEDMVENFLRELAARRLTDLAMQPMFCVALCRVFAEADRRALPAGRGALFDTLTDILLAGAARRETAVDVKPERLRELLMTHAGERERPNQVPLPLDSLIDHLLDRERLASSKARWSEMVRTHLYGSGLLTPNSPDEQPFSHQLLAAYFSARYWGTRHPQPGPDHVREIAVNCMKSHTEDHALFCAEHIMTTVPDVVAALLTSWPTSRQRPAAVMTAKLARDGAPVPKHLLAHALKTLTRWATKADSPSPPRTSPSLPNEPGWPQWAAAQIAYLEQKL
ncbi:trypsin-like peptidase domain-containing protein [Streptomyces sp. NPDC058464]|uniref:trypsin-like peptidase domain-containing protein n=1 Tax=Streptomyces sp. NPDC058464 TaxID=3346511 RepID=UPI00365BF8AD